MEFSDKKHKLESAIINNPKFTHLPEEEHWLYVPEEVREAILGASEELTNETIATITKREQETIGRWFKKNEHVVKLGEKGEALQEIERAPASLWQTHKTRCLQTGK